MRLEAIRRLHLDSIASWESGICGCCRWNREKGMLHRRFRRLGWHARDSRLRSFRCICFNAQRVHGSSDSASRAPQSNPQLQIRANPLLALQGVRVVETPRERSPDRSRFAKAQRGSSLRANEVSNSTLLSPRRAFKSLGGAKGATGAVRRARRGRCEGRYGGVAKGATGALRRALRGRCEGRYGGGAKALRVMRAIRSVPAMQIETQSARHLCSPTNQPKTTLHQIQQISNKKNHP